MKVTKHHIASRQAWLAMRTQDLTASDIAAARGRSPFKSQLALYAEKAGLIDPPPLGPIARRGLWFEPAVVEAVKDEHPDWQLVPREEAYYRAPEFRLGATPDRLCYIEDKPVNLQLKVVAKPEHDKHWEHGVPFHYQLQATCEAMLVGAAYSMVAALVVNTYSADLYTYKVSRHPGAEDAIRRTAIAFWRNIEHGVRPAAVDASDAAILQKLYPDSQADPVLDLSGNNRLPGLLERRVVLKATEKAAKAEIESIDTEIKDALDAHQRASLPGWKISWPTIHVAEKIIPATSFRRLTVSKLKEDD